MHDYFPSLSLSRTQQLRLWMKDPVSLIRRGEQEYGKSFFLTVGSLEPTLVTGEASLVKKTFQDAVGLGDDNQPLLPCCLGRRCLYMAA